MATQAKRRKDRLTPSQARAARRQRRHRRRRAIRVGAFVAIAVVSILFVVSLFANSLPISIGGPSGELTGFEERFPEQPYSPHIRVDQEHAAYNSVPATSGWHYDNTARWGVHDEFVPDEILVHNLEHGGVRIHYDCPEGCPELVDDLAEIARRASEVILSPYPNMESKIALVSWTYLERLEEFDKERIEAFIDGHMNSPDAPEPLAR